MALRAPPGRYSEDVTIRVSSRVQRTGTVEAVNGDLGKDPTIEVVDADLGNDIRAVLHSDTTTVRRQVRAVPIVRPSATTSADPLRSIHVSRVFRSELST